MDSNKPNPLELAETVTDSHPKSQSGYELESIRSILFAQEQARIRALEERAATLSQTDQEQAERLLARAQTLQTEIDALQQAAQAHQIQAETLQTRLDQLRADITAESEALIPRITDEMSSMISTTIRDSRDEMAEALGPVMGDAIRVQIRDSRDEIIDAIYPIILSTVQRAIAEFARELQRNIDARFKTTFGPQGLFNNFMARLRGVSSSELAIREALPFAIQELFLIQHESGLLLAHLAHEDEDNSDSDLISGMLTAIRDFAHDSFGDGSDDESLNEILYGDEQIVIQSGQYVYLAVVINGIEPEWFRSRLRSFVSELHIQHAPALRDYSGDPAALPDLPLMLAALSTDLASPQETQPEPMSREQKLALAGGGFLSLLLLAAACFYLQFTIALYPLAFGQATETATLAPTSALMVMETAVPQPTNTAPSTFTPLPTATTEPTPTEPPLPTATTRPEEPAVIPTNTPVPSLGTAVTNAPVWVRPIPDAQIDPIGAIALNTEVAIVSEQGEWMQVEWVTATGLQQGWVPIQWLDLQ